MSIFSKIAKAAVGGAIGFAIGGPAGAFAGAAKSLIGSAGGAGTTAAAGTIGGGPDPISGILATPIPVGVPLDITPLTTEGIMVAPVASIDKEPEENIAFKLARNIESSFNKE